MTPLIQQKHLFFNQLHFPDRDVNTPPLGLKKEEERKVIRMQEGTSGRREEGGEEQMDEVLTEGKTSSSGKCQSLEELQD